jgi:phosphoribosylamine--glycine ligase
MKVLVVGGGGREHAMCWKLRQSPELEELYCAPGNPGIAEVADLVPVAADEISALIDAVGELKIDLTVVGPELPLSLGLADELRKRGKAVYGHPSAAAELESSKVFSKEFMRRHDIPTADFIVTHDADEARAAAREFGFPVVLKADGLAAGKGVLIVESEPELEPAIDVFFTARKFGASGDRVVVEQHLTGEEVSFMALCDGHRLLPLATSKDYKRIGDGDTGPNTGGMGSHSPSGLYAQDLVGSVIEGVLRRTVDGMAAESRRMSGVIYAGVMLTDDGPKVLEYNVRLGDPEAQSVLLRLDDDLLPVLASGAEGEFHTSRLHFRKEASACLVLGSAGYPGTPARGDVIEGIEAAKAMPEVEVFHAGTALEDGRIIATGGRVLNVCAHGEDLADALRKAYRAAAEIQWPNKVLRHDIGRRVLENLR